MGFANKLMGQVNLFREGQKHINDNGLFTLTSGVLSQNPMPGSSSISMVNAGIEGFVRAAALEAQRGIRVNAVSPIWVKKLWKPWEWIARKGCLLFRLPWHTKKV